MKTDEQAASLGSGLPKEARFQISVADLRFESGPHWARLLLAVERAGMTTKFQASLFGAFRGAPP